MMEERDLARTVMNGEGLSFRQTPNTNIRTALGAKVL